MCRKKKTKQRDGAGGRKREGENSKSSKKERKIENREFWNIYRRLETDVKK